MSQEAVRHLAAVLRVPRSHFEVEALLDRCRQVWFNRVAALRAGVVSPCQKKRSFSVCSVGKGFRVELKGIWQGPVRTQSVEAYTDRAALQDAGVAECQLQPNLLLQQAQAVMLRREEVLRSVASSVGAPQKSLEGLFCKGRLAATVRACERDSCMEGFTFGCLGTGLRVSDSSSSCSVFPGFRNHGNTCYLNSLLQCFFHCRAVRSWCHAADDVDGSALSSAFRRLCQDYVSRNPAYAVLSPLEVLWRLVQAYPFLAGGLQRDAAEVCGMLMSVVGFAGELCDSQAERLIPGFAGVSHMLFPDLPECAREMTHVGLQALLSDALLGDCACGVLPPLLVISFANMYEVADSDFFVSTTVDDMDASVDLLGNYTGFPDMLASSRYAVRAFVEHKHAGCASRAATSGHYVAHIRNGDEWFVADDSIVFPCSQTPHPFPAILFLERLDCPVPEEFPLLSHSDAREPLQWLPRALSMCVHLQLDGDVIMALPSHALQELGVYFSASDDADIPSENLPVRILSLLRGSIRGIRFHEAEEDSSSDCDSFQASFGGTISSEDSVKDAPVELPRKKAQEKERIERKEADDDAQGRKGCVQDRAQVREGGVQDRTQVHEGSGQDRAQVHEGSVQGQAQVREGRVQDRAQREGRVQDRAQREGRVQEREERERDGRDQDQTQQEGLHE
ncbi:MAG: ubiquitin carboxyl-terminal hydrolase, partial [Planctomycetaceae bacterium]|nr:ubiquitin carboxyl-terminal hydrolase [Planctomycetaceae bacterium]